MKINTCRVFKINIYIKVTFICSCYIVSWLQLLYLFTNGTQTFFNIIGSLCILQKTVKKCMYLIILIIIKKIKFTTANE